MRALFIFGSIALYIACAFVPPSEANVRSFAEKAKRLQLSSVDTSVLVDTASKALDGVKNVATLRQAAVLVPSSKAVLEHVTSSVSDFVVTESSAALRSQFERIRWAATKSDPRLCKVLAESRSDVVESGKPSFGDLLAFCLAETTGEPRRCDQIDAVNASSLYDACVKELALRS